MAEFFHMGGYGVFVWSSYAVVAVVLIGLTAWTIAALRRANAEMNDLEAMAPRRRRRRQGAQSGEGTDNAES